MKPRRIRRTALKRIIVFHWSLFQRSSCAAPALPLIQVLRSPARNLTSGTAPDSRAALQSLGSHQSRILHQIADSGGAALASGPAPEPFPAGSIVGKLRQRIHRRPRAHWCWDRGFSTGGHRSAEIHLGGSGRFHTISKFNHRRQTIAGRMCCVHNEKGNQVAACCIPPHVIARLSTVSRPRAK